MLAILAKAAAAVKGAVVGSALDATVKPVVTRAVKRVTGLEGEAPPPPTAHPPSVGAAAQAARTAESTLAAMSEQARVAAGKLNVEGMSAQARSAAGALNNHARNAAGAVGALSEQARQSAGAMGTQAKALAESMGENGRWAAGQAAAQVREEARRRTRRLLAYGVGAVVLAAFAYGLGSSLPTQVRLYLEGAARERDRDKKGEQP